MEGGLEKIQTLEDSMIRTREDRPDLVGRAPVFTTPLSNVDSLREGENVHFEARVIPTDDPRLKVEWFWNGKPLKAGSRFRTFCDFGFVILEISPVYPEDTGEYSFHNEKILRQKCVLLEITHNFSSCNEINNPDVPSRI